MMPNGDPIPQSTTIPAPTTYYPGQMTYASRFSIDKWKDLRIAIAHRYEKGDITLFEAIEANNQLDIS